MTNIAVLGLGNVLLGDDGIGPYVIEGLRAAYDFPDDVSILDVGTPGLGLSVHLTSADAVILVDAVTAPGAPGQVRLYRRDDLERLPPQPRVSPHDPAVQEALWLASFAGDRPRELLLIGVIPERVTVGTGLSDSVRRACPAVIEAVLSELARLGAPATPRIAAQHPDIWWAAE